MSDIAAEQAMAFVRREDAETLPPPTRQTGAIGWLRANLFATPVSSFLTLVFLALAVFIVWNTFEWAVLDAVWTGDDRQACLGPDVGACWAYVRNKFHSFIYGRYPFDARWRVDLTVLLFLAGFVPMLIPSVPYKRETVFYLLVVFPVVAFILLSGGNFDYNGFLLPDSWIAPSVYKFILEFALIAAIVGAAAVAFAVAVEEDWRRFLLFALSPFAAAALLLLVCGIDFGLAPVRTNQWGGLMLTLVVAMVGITGSLPIGILLALGRRSKMPIVRYFCIGFIELWRGVPMVTVLFMANVMLPLFLPPGTDVDRLLRALVGVTMFSSAYMAEIVRGGLQAIPRGQYEAAAAMGLGYWQMMRLIILPQALKIVIPGIVNTFIGLFKDTTLVVFVGLFDLLGMVQASLDDQNWATPHTAATGFVFAAMIYWVFCFGMSRYSLFMERRLNAGQRR
jgi:general L-amino acid transport system permease protein